MRLTIWEKYDSEINFILQIILQSLTMPHAKTALHATLRQIHNA